MRLPVLVFALYASGLLAGCILGPVSTSSGETADLQVQKSQSAYQAYFSGDLETALAALNSDLQGTTSQKERLSLLHLKAKVLMAGGQAAAALSLGHEIRELESVLTGKAFLAESLLGEAYLLLGDYESARQVVDYAATADPLEQPSLYVTYTQAKAAYVLAQALMLQQDYEQALRWSQKARSSFEQMAQKYDSVGLDKVLQDNKHIELDRALNQAQLAALLVIENKGGNAQSDSLVMAANSFFEEVNYPPALVNSLALQAYAYFEIGQWSSALEKARAVSAIGQHARLFDVWWQMEALMGECYLKIGDKAAAASAFVTAQNAIELVSGALSIDRAENKFGMSRSLVHHRLIDLLLDFGHVDKAFAAAERARAIAYVDLAENIQPAQQSDPELSQWVQELDQKIVWKRHKYSFAFPETTDSILKQEQSLVAKRAILIQQLSKRSPHEAATYAVHTATLFDVQSSLKANQVMVYFLPNDQDGRLRWIRIAQDEVLLEHSKAKWGAQSREASLKQLQVDMNLSGSQKRDQQVLLVPFGELRTVSWGDWVSGGLSVLFNATELVYNRPT